MKGTDAVHEKMKQIHDLKMLMPVDAGKMSGDEKSDSDSEALRYLMFLKWKQRRFIDKVSRSSPTISTEALFLS